MARIPQEELEQLKAQIDLVALVQSKGVELKKHGADLVGHCPFHDDRTPSLVVTPGKNLWHCLGACQIGGSVIDWVMKCNQVSFRHAVELLRSGDAKILLTSKKPTGYKSRVRKLPPPVDSDASDQALYKQVLGYYQESLKGAPEALSYLAARGIESTEAIEKFQLGFANRTLGLRLPPNHCVDGAKIRSRLTKLGIYRESGHEHFNGSIVFPVISLDGKVTEIYGRKITPKLRPGTPYHTYLPGPHRGIWNPECVSGGEVILCEALIDALTFWVHGFKNVTASYGVEGFTDEHLRAFIDGGVRKVLIAYDRDEAGDNAAIRLSKLLLGEGIACSRVLFPKGMDANEYACKMKPPAQALRVCLEAADPLGKPVQKKAPEPLPEAKAEAWVIPPKREATPVIPLEMASPSLAAAPAVPELFAQLTKDTAPTEPSAPAVREDEKPKAAPVDVPTEIKGEDVLIRLGEREYRVRGLQKNLSYEVMKVNVRVAVGLKYHVDQLDLYQAKARVAYIHAAHEELGIVHEVIKRDLGRVLFRLEELQDEHIRRALEGGKAKKEVELEDHERAAALALLRGPDLLQTILDDFGRCGVVGEEVNKLVGYLAAVSRKLEEPLAIIIQSSSAAGKSSLMEAVLAMMPEEDKVKYSAMTGQSLFYMGEKDLKNKILAIAEEQGATQASYALKLLQSEGEISIASTGKDSNTGRLITHQYRVEGPVMIFLTTTAIEIDEELLNRCIVLTVNETREQTRAIHELQRKGQTLEGLLLRQEREHVLTLHRNAQRLLRPLWVVNPYASRLTFLDSRTRTRRDHIKYLTLIRTIALLHQHSRETKWTSHRGKPIEYIEVKPQDIEIANRLCHQVLGRSLDELPPQTRKLLTLVCEMVEEERAKAGVERKDYRFTRRQVRAHTGWSDFQVQVHMNKLVALEYVLTHRGGRGQSFVYELLFDGKTAAGTQVLMGLIDPTTLSTPAYDSHPEGLTQSFEHPKGQSEGSSSPIRAPIEGGSRMPGNGSGSGEAAKNEEIAIEKDMRGISPAVIIPYVKAGSARQDSSGGGEGGAP